MEWDYSGRKGRDGQKKKIGKAKERKEKVKRGKDKEVNGQWGKRCAPAPHGAVKLMKEVDSYEQQCQQQLLYSTVVKSKEFSFKVHNSSQE